jgi:hypothetical protein
MEWNRYAVVAIPQAQALMIMLALSAQLCYANWFFDFKVIG